MKTRRVNVALWVEEIPGWELAVQCRLRQAGALVAKGFSGGKLVDSRGKACGSYAVEMKEEEKP